jgi:hypothetical protein
MDAIKTSKETNRDCRRLLSTAAMAIVVAGAAGLFPSQLVAVSAGDAVRSFRVDIPEEQLVDLRRRIAATRWPDKETVNDRSQGVQLSNFQELVRYGAQTTTGEKARPSSTRSLNS